MKSSIVFVALYFALSLLACQDTKYPEKSFNTDYEFYKTIGEQIPFETGMRWIDTYKSRNNAARIASFQYKITASQLQSILQQSPELTGIAFHYAQDEEGNTHILVIPVDGSLKLWSLSPENAIIDTNTESVIDQTTARAWAQNYKNSHPFDIWFHFFGRNIFDEIATISYFSKLDIQPGINDSNLPQLLLIVWNLEVSASGRKTDDAGVVYDASNPCPPCPVN